MPTSVKGVGTKFYGQREFGPDGSYITTEWFTVLHLPIFPIRSFRAIFHGRERVVGPFYQKDHYSLSRPMVPNWRQVLNVYLYVIALIGFGISVSMNFDFLTRQFGLATVTAGIIAVLSVFLMVRRFCRNSAIRRAGLRRVRRSRRR